MRFSKFCIAARLILEEAYSRKIIIDEISSGEVCELKFGDHIEYLRSRCSSKTTSVANYICRHKDISKDFLSLAGLSLAKGKTFMNDQLNRAISYCEKEKLWPIVAKPVSAGNGRSVFVGIKNKKELKKIWGEIDDKEGKNLIEECHEGVETRVLVTREKALAAIQRVPANVTGNGKSTIQDLIYEKNLDPRRKESEDEPIVKIKIDAAMLLKLESEGLNLSSIVEKDKTVFLRNNSNISTGGDSYDVTDEVHESVKEIALKAINSIPGLLYAGVDILSKDFRKPQTKDSYIVVEINSNPGIDMHHFPYSGKPRNVAKDIVDVIFPETKTD